MLFFIAAFVFMIIGRKAGWLLSRVFLYNEPNDRKWMVISSSLCTFWGIAVAASIYGLIDWQHPGVLLRWTMGYALGVYVAIPNFGLVNESTIPPDAHLRHTMISNISMVSYIAWSIFFALRFPHVQPFGA